MLHCTNGDVVVGGLTAAGVPGRVVAAADVLHEGPCEASLSPEAWRRRRAAFLADGDGARAAAIGRSLAERDAVLDEAAAAGEEIVLWFEHDLFDQLNLIWLIDALALRGVPPDRISLIVIGSHPSVARFHGLGQLSPSDLAGLLPARLPLPGAGMTDARRAWDAVCASSPELMESEAARDHPALPFLPAALARLLEELPGMEDGLSRVERQGLAAVRDGAGTLGAAFVAQAAQEPAVFLGDLSFYRAMRNLAAAATPLVALGPGQDGPDRSRTVTLTGAGRAALEGSADHAALNGLDRWVGGVRLEGRAPAWRWDGGRRRSMRMPRGNSM